MPKSPEVACWCGRFPYPHRYVPECYRWLQEEALRDAELRKAEDERSTQPVDSGMPIMPRER